MAVVIAAMSGDATVVHPFFHKTPGHARQESNNDTQDPPTRPQNNGQPCNEDAPATSHAVAESKAKEGQIMRTQRRSIKMHATSKGQMTLSQVLNPTSSRARVQDARTEDSDLEHIAMQEEAVSDGGRHKRRRTSVEQSVDVGNEPSELGTTLRSSPPANTGDRSRLGSPQILIPRSSPLPASAPTVSNGDPHPDTNASIVSQTPPKKMLKLNAKGKFSSPVSRTRPETPDDSLGQDQKHKRRSRRYKDKIPPSELIVRMHYQNDGAPVNGSTTGQKIAQILSGQLSVHPEPPTLKKKRAPRKPAKPTHPFFHSKPDPPTPMKLESRKTAAITPGKLRAQTLSDRVPDDREPFIPARSALLTDRLMVKHPGAREPPWPTRDTVHVRGVNTMHTPRVDCTVKHRKQKNARKVDTMHESVFTRFSSQLEQEPQTETRADGFNEPHPSLRLPERLLMSGQEIASNVTKVISVPLESGPTSDILHPASSQETVHPALTKIHSSLPDYISAFDEVRGESSSWTQKHSPGRAIDVLQPTKEMIVLKQWLQSLTVNAVDATKSGPDKITSPSQRPKKRRKPRPDDLNDFIIDDEEDAQSMGTISDSESVAQLNGPRSVVQTQLQGIRSSNAVLISGPHGCGKTAAVYAIAHELNFKVFEISSAERRSGKDVFDKVGDVTENHIVRHGGPTDTVETQPAEESDRIDTAFQKDLESGRQGKMNAFFKPKSTNKPALTKLKVNTLPEASKSNTIKTVQNVLKKQAKEQQQSLILLEEVDVLFKEDKDFWNTVLKLIASSKRPFILTCNDEDLVPMQAMPLHAILRFLPQPTDLAVDYLLLVAAKEGHLLRRDAVAHLWHTSGQDLRKSITTLDFWCRMGVGDIRSGLGWILQRWPPGCDLDADGRQLRVVSKGTFDATLGASPQQADMIDRMKAANDKSGLSPTGLLRWHNLDEAQFIGSSNDVSADGLKGRLESLKRFGSFADALSAVDVFSRPHETDATLPTLPEKRRAHYIEGMHLLESNEPIDFTGLRAELSVVAVLTAFKAYLPGKSQADYDQRIYKHDTTRLTRKDFSVFDSLAVPISSQSASSGLDASIFDGPLPAIVTDVAPYVRQIVQYDLMLEEQRYAIGGTNKRMRTTRAARSALEGGQRQLTRREKWWEGVGDLRGVLATAGDGWDALSREYVKPDTNVDMEGSEA